MKKLLSGLFLATLCLLSNQAQAWNQRSPLPVAQCQIHAPYGFPQIQGSVQPICREAYLSAYDPQAKIPRLVMWTLTPQHALGCFPRSNAFVADQSIANGPTPQDYVGTGYDKGHMAPDGDQGWNQQINYESFLMTNMAPQAGSFNRGIWRSLETSVRGWTYQLGNSFTVVSGAVYQQGDKTIGKNVTVPHAFYKIVINDNTGAVAGWWFPHTPPYSILGNDLTKFRMPISNIEQAAGVKFAMPANARELSPGQEWPVNFAALNLAKRKLCGAGAAID